MMTKQIPQAAGQEQWNSQLVEDLQFIKKHRRYPFRRMTLMPLLGSGFALAFMARMIWMLMVVKQRPDNIAFLFLITFLVLTPIIIAVKRYIELIGFKEIRTGFVLADNLKLLQQFLKEQQLLVARHPDAPEILQIISRPLETFGDEREVLIFIADDSRILVNSHFTSNRRRFRLWSAPTHQGPMIRKLKDWLNSRQQAGTALVK